ncbi:Sodium/glutamate symporter [Caprobacter fermentans]|uniref:Sodium/glutamate symporter n=1 Tax=Caproicibacter fermentans TaxID=2576756 RepID=A0A6N8I2K5_9FIRM|nr:sodium/glutamate symporter [Caproicibacter fermentans]MVB12366.1 Sodium/glutamate symporter [Caproicibacter fermentans]QNK40600.1 sodium:glutamate symporter [Caproicibacter fermentans]
MDKIMAYFGTFTAAKDGAVASFKFEYLTTLLFAAIVIFAGQAMVKHSKLLRKYAIPAPVVSGLIFSIIVSVLKGSGTIGFEFDTKIMKDFTQNIFFLCVGFGFSTKMLKHAGGKLCAKIAFAAVLLITLQDVAGVALGKVIGMDPLLALQCSSSAMSGGVGTASAFGPIFKGWGADAATTVGVAAGTMGNIMGSVIGGPVAAFLIARYSLKADPNDKPAELATGKVNPLENHSMVRAFAMLLLLAGLGMPIYCLLDNIPMISMPKFIGCLFAGAIGRNVLEATHQNTYEPEVNALEHMFLELYLALVLMTIDLTKLVSVAGQMGIILLMQAVLIAVFGIFISFRLFGKDYGAAVMTAGNIGWGCGSGPNAVANEKAIMDEYGWHNIAWVLYPSFAVIIDDIYNPIFLSVFGSLFKH